jgi:cytochrome c oxidase subunit 1
MAAIQPWVYSIGLLIFARGLISGGLQGMPRRTFLAQAPYSGEGWELAGALTGIGGTIMTIGILMFFLVIVMTWFVGKKGEVTEDIPISETLSAPATTGWETKLDRLGLWIVAAIVLILIAYGPFFLTYSINAVSPGFKIF